VTKTAGRVALHLAPMQALVRYIGDKITGTKCAARLPAGGFGYRVTAVFRINSADLNTRLATCISQSCSTDVIISIGLKQRQGGKAFNLDPAVER
jgi:hypothetical protein